jgi:hypothetical protein
MRRLFPQLLAGLLLASSCVPARAFSLLGAYDAWMTPEVGLNLPFDIGGSMNLGEEYRWTIPVITYGFDESFLNYFGTKGVEEIEKAISVFNNLPPFSKMSADLSEFPLDTRRFNHRARALVLHDLRSFAMASLLEVLGVGPAERYAWQIRSRAVINNIPLYAVTKRNFDPVTFEPTAYVNGTLYTYLILQTWTIPAYEAVEFEVDPTRPTVSSLSGFNVGGGTIGSSGYLTSFEPGLFYTGLTRDDVGALRYIYRAQNVNVETLPPGVVGAPLNSGGSGLIGSGQNTSSPWGIPPSLATNLTTLFTNLTTTVTNGAAVSQALRPGIDKLVFTRVDFDSFTGGWVTLTNRYEDMFITNSTLVRQLVDRPLAGPDVLFSAADLGVIAATGEPFVYFRNVNWLSQDAINGTQALSGPGVINPQTTMTFTKLGQWLFNVGDGGQADALDDFWWGSFDGTTNAPVVYPSGASIKALENLILSGQADRLGFSSPWSSP